MPPRTPIIVLAGQSNATGTAITGAVMQAANAQGALVLHHAANGSALSADLSPASGTWHPPAAGQPAGVNYQTLSAHLRGLLDPAAPGYLPGAYLHAVIWIQGEADTVSPATAAAYGQNLHALHAAMTDAFGPHDLILSQLSRHPAQLADLAPARAGGWQTVRAEQAALARAQDRIGSLDPDSLGQSAQAMFRADMIHYETGFAVTLGRALAGMAAPTTAGPEFRSLTGTDGADRLVPGLTGAQQVLGGRGTDTLDLGRTGAPLSLVDSPGLARLAGHSVTLTMLQVECVVLGGGDDRAQLGGAIRWIAGGRGDDRLLGGDRAVQMHGGSGADTLIGGRGDDDLRGGDGTDHLAGGAGADRISGSAGSDHLRGGTGNDRLWGGPGADSFYFRPGAGRDVVHDFRPGEDRVILTTDRLPAVTRNGDDLLLASDGGLIRLVDAAPGWQIDRDLFLN